MYFKILKNVVFRNNQVRNYKIREIQRITERCERKENLQQKSNETNVMKQIIIKLTLNDYH